MDLPKLPEDFGTATFLGSQWERSKKRPTPQHVWVYRLSSPNWQQAVLTSDGMFAVVSDYGNYAYNWVNWGDGDFQPFFAKLHGPSLLRKIAKSRDEFRQAETTKDLRETILEAYRSRELTKDKLREVLGILRAADLESVEGVENFFNEDLCSGDTIEEVLGCDAWDVIHHGPEYDSDAVNYCEKLLPVLQQAVRGQVAGGGPHG